MQFWSGTAFMDATEAPAVARMLDEAGYDGIICADHLIYPRALASPYPSPTGRPMWPPDRLARLGRNLPLARYRAKGLRAELAGGG